jgi:alanyl-tRNA synthetase
VREKPHKNRSEEHKMKNKTVEGIKKTQELINKLKADIGSLTDHDLWGNIKYCLEELEICCKEELKRRSEDLKNEFPMGSIVLNYINENKVSGTVVGYDVRANVIILESKKIGKWTADPAKCKVLAIREN